MLLSLNTINTVISKRVLSKKKNYNASCKCNLKFSLNVFIFKNEKETGYFKNVSTQNIKKYSD